MGFQKNVEDFICEHCGEKVKGNGYTNHCPKCLWSKHVDIDPGDRAAECAGMMEPLACERQGDSWMLTQKCVACGHTRRNTMSRGDNFDVAVKISPPHVKVSP